MEKAPSAAGQSLIALDFVLAPPREFAVIAGADPAEFRAALEAIYARFLPHKVVAPRPGRGPAAATRPAPGRPAGPGRQGRPTSASTSPARPRWWASRPSGWRRGG